MHVTFAIYLIIYLVITCISRHASHARSRQLSKSRNSGLRYFRGSRVNFRSDGEYRESQELSHYGRNNPQKKPGNANISPSPSFSFSLIFSRRAASRSVTRDSTEILIHLRSHVKRTSLRAIYIMHGYMPRILCIHRSDHVYHVFFFAQKKDPYRICKYYSLSYEIITNN